MVQRHDLPLVGITGTGGSPGTPPRTAAAAAAVGPGGYDMTKRAADRVAEVPSLGSTATAGEVLSEYLHTQAGDFLRSLRLHRESGADVEEAAEAARLLRRAARRISGALSVYRPITDTAWSDQLRAELAWLSGTLALEHAYAGRLTRLRDALHRLSGAGGPPDRTAEGDAAAGEPAATGVDPEAVGASGSTTFAARTARGGVTAGIDGPSGAAPRSSRTARRSVSLATGAPDPSPRAARGRPAAPGAPDGGAEAPRRPYEGYEEWHDEPPAAEGRGTGGTGTDAAEAAGPGGGSEHAAGPADGTGAPGRGSAAGGAGASGGVTGGGADVPGQTARHAEGAGAPGREAGTSGRHAAGAAGSAEAGADGMGAVAAGAGGWDAAGASAPDRGGRAAGAGGVDAAGAAPEAGGAGAPGQGGWAEGADGADAGRPVAEAGADDAGGPGRGAGAGGRGADVVGVDDAAVSDRGAGVDGVGGSARVAGAGGRGAGVAGAGTPGVSGRAGRAGGRAGGEAGRARGAEGERGTTSARSRGGSGRTAAHQRAGDPEEARGGALTVGAARAGALLERQLTLAKTRAHTAALQALGSSRFHAVADTVALLASEVPLDETTAGRPAEQVLPPLAELANRRLIEAVDALPLGRAGHPYNAEALVHGLAATPAADSPPASDRQDAPWNQVRRLVRMRRYALEVLQVLEVQEALDARTVTPAAGDAEPSEATRLLAAGQALERHRDAAEAAAAAAAAARTPRIAPATAYALGVLHADQRHEVEAARFAFGRMWRRVNSRASR